MNDTSAESQAPALVDQGFDRSARTVMAIVVLGVITTVLDATIVSIALERLSSGFEVPLTVVQWVMTGYLLAFTAAIPITGWAVDRYGARPVWLTAVGVFTVGSLLCGIAWSAESLIGFRVLQGIGAGMVSPVGITMVARAVGQQRMGRAMAVIGIPMMLGPIAGPVLGGVLISTVDWRWIFFINLPIGLVCLAWSARALERAPGGHRERLDVLGLALLSPGLVALVYGLTSWSGTGQADTRVIVGCVVGIVLLAGFVVHALRAPHPLIDLRHFSRRGFATAATLQFIGVGVMTGAMLLLPLYFIIARGETELVSGLLLAPQGIGAAIAMKSTGKLVDNGHGRSVVVVGLLVMVAGLFGYTTVGGGASLAVLMPSLFGIGVGAGCIFAPTSAAAYAALERAAIAKATTTLSILQRSGGAIATAVFATVLQTQLTGPDGPADAFAFSFGWPLALVVIALIPAILLPAPAPKQDAG